MTERQSDQKWVDDTRAEYLRRARAKSPGGLLALIEYLRGAIGVEE